MIPIFTDVNPSTCPASLPKHLWSLELGGLNRSGFAGAVQWGRKLGKSYFGYKACPWLERGNLPAKLAEIQAKLARNLQRT